MLQALMESHIRARGTFVPSLNTKTKNNEPLT